MNLGWKSRRGLDCGCHFCTGPRCVLCSWEGMVRWFRLCQGIGYDGFSLWMASLLLDFRPQAAPGLFLVSPQSWGLPIITHVPANALTEFSHKRNFHKPCFFLNQVNPSISFGFFMRLRKLFFIFSSILDVFVGRVGESPSPPFVLQKWLKFTKKNSICNKAYRLFVSEQNRRNQKARRDLRPKVTQASSVSGSLLLQESFCASQV